MRAYRWEMRARLANQVGAGDEPAARETLRQVWEMIVEGSAGKGLGEMRLPTVQVMAIANRGAHGGGADPDRLHGDVIEVLDAFAQADSEARLLSISMDGVAKLAALVRANGGPGGKMARRAVENIGAPVLDGMVTGFKMAEMMAEVHHLTGLPPASRLGYFRQPREGDYGILRTFRRQ